MPSSTETIKSGGLLAYSSLFWKTPDLERELAQLRQTGWQGWETRQSLDWLGSARRLRRICEEIGVEVAAVCGPNATLSTRDATHQINKRRIEFAADLGVATFMTKGPGRLDRTTTDDDLKQMAAVYDDLSVYGESLGVAVTFHPHINHLVDSADEWRRFMALLQHCRLCLDMSHAVHWGYDPIQAVRDYADRLAYVHLHDYKDDRTVELGEGPMCDYVAFLKTLEEVGYRGWITVCPGQTERSDHEKMQINRAYLHSIGY